MWFLTVDPLIRISAFIAKLSERILLACSRGLSLSRTYPILWHTQLPLHASALHHWLLWPSSDFLMSRFPLQQNSSPFCWPCASTSRVYNKFPFLWFNCWWVQVHTQSPIVGIMLLYHSPLILRCFWPASTLLHGTSLSQIPSRVETDPQISEEHWGYAAEDHMGKSFQAMDFGLEC